MKEAIFVIAIILNSASSEVNISNSMYLSGDIIIGGLFSVHSAERKGNCGPVSPFFGIQEIGNVIYSLTEVNRILKTSCGFQLGMVAMDTCFDTERALELSLIFAQNRYRNIGQLNVTSPCNTNSLLCSINDKIIAVIGPTASDASISVATLLKLFKIPQVILAFFRFLQF